MKPKIRVMINSLSGGGAEKVLVDLLNQLDFSCYEVELLTVTGGIHQKRLPAGIRHRQIIRCSGEKMSRFFYKLIMKLPRRIFAALFMRGKFDIEIAYLEGKPTRFVAGKGGKSKKIAFVHCDISKKNIIAPYYRSNEACIREYRKFAKVCFVSEQSKTGFEKTVGTLDNGCVVHNVVDIDRIKRLSQEAADVEFSPNSRKMVSVGRLAPEKAFDRLLRCVASLEDRFPMELIIIGEGPEREKLERIIQQNHIRSVKLPGYRENPYSIVKQADLFVCSSIFEGYSTAVTEAVALGIPVLTTRCAGMDEILAGGTYGVIVDNSEEALLEELHRFLDDPADYAAIRETVKAGSREQDCGYSLREYTELFASVLSEAH